MRSSASKMKAGSNASCSIFVACRHTVYGKVAWAELGPPRSAHASGGSTTECKKGCSGSLSFTYSATEVLFSSLLRRKHRHKKR